jgi:hypothetical protein
VVNQTTTKKNIRNFSLTHFGRTHQPGNAIIRPSLDWPHIKGIRRNRELSASKGEFDGRDRVTRDGPETLSGGARRILCARDFGQDGCYFLRMGDNGRCAYVKWQRKLDHGVSEVKEKKVPVSRIEFWLEMTLVPFTVTASSMICQNPYYISNIRRFSTSSSLSDDITHFLSNGSHHKIPLKQIRVHPSQEQLGL